MQQPENLLVVFFGMIAAGKSYLAASWADRHQLPCYNSDRVRKELAGFSPETGQKEEVDQGIYSPEFSRRTYDALIELAADHFQKNHRAAVVLDGSYQSLSERELLRKQFADHVRLLFVYCHCSDEVVRQRLKIRVSDPDAVSDGNWEIYLAQKKRFQLPTDGEGVLVLNTDAPLQELMAEVDKNTVAGTGAEHGIA